jgi:hypothetical protein
VLFFLDGNKRGKSKASTGETKSKRFVFPCWFVGKKTKMKKRVGPASPLLGAGAPMPKPTFVEPIAAAAAAASVWYKPSQPSTPFCPSQKTILFLLVRRSILFIWLLETILSTVLQ